MNEYKYPTPYETKEVFNSFLKRSYVDYFCQSLGIFYINARQEDVATNLSRILYSKNEIDLLRSNAYQTISKHTLSGFSLQSSASDFSLQEIYEKIRDNDRTQLSKNYKLNSLVKVLEQGTIPIYKGSLEYTKKKPGRIEFLDEETGYTEFQFIDKGNGEWQVEVDGNKSSDGKEVLKLISDIIDKHTTELFDINIDALISRSTIEFFDELAKTGLGKDWKLTDIKHLAFKRGKDNDNDEENEGGESLENEQLTGISQAILEGRNLREDPFVVQYEKDGCIFTAMTYEFENSKTPYTIQVRAEFKGSPKIFEVSIVSYKVSKGVNAKKEPETLSPDQHRELRSLFWNNAKSVYNGIIKKNISYKD